MKKKKVRRGDLGLDLAENAGIIILYGCYYMGGNARL